MAPQVNPAFAPVEDNPNLPRVLLIGDSISIGYTLPLRDLLQGKANLHRPPTNCGPSKRGVEEIDAWLGAGPWDAIHFNWGLHDIVHMTADGTRIDPPQGQHQVEADQYQQHLTDLVTRLKQTGAKLIWCATTPVPTGASFRHPGDEVEYNAIAQKVMDAQGVPTNDLYSYALERLAAIQQPANVHFTADGSAELAKPVAAYILDVLGQ
ncbi:MAG: SGNH/GDSL hydrolase family protein [Candidatus Latescibacteria bacterium]|nr:SGNH/GDSL hydrolase family protein [Candidatus Latescibacterota bacterium]